MTLLPGNQENDSFSKSLCIKYFEPVQGVLESRTNLSSKLYKNSTLEFIKLFETIIINIDILWLMSLANDKLT